MFDYYLFLVSWLLVIYYMFLPQSNYKTLIPKILLSLAMLIGAGILVYNNFIKEKKFFFLPPEMINQEELYNKFNLDILEDESFKELRAAKKVATPTSENLGRENPFLKF